MELWAAKEVLQDQKTLGNVGAAMVMEVRLPEIAGLWEPDLILQDAVCKLHPSAPPS
jgi:hypothetical protein